MPRGAWSSLLEKQQGRSEGALRLAVIGGGCSGLQYKMDLVEGPAPRDILVHSANVRIVVDPKSALFVSGSTLDFSDDLQKGGFKVTQSKRHLTLLLRRKLRRLTERQDQQDCTGFRKSIPLIASMSKSLSSPLVWSVCFVDATLQPFNAPLFI